MNYKSQLEQTPFRNRTHAVWFRLCAVCLSMYISYVTYLAHSRMFLGRMSTGMSMLAFVAASTGVYALLELACSRLGAPKTHPARDHVDMRVFALAFLAALGVFGCTFAACYPGGVNYDVSNQWRQAHSGEFNNWHPLFHTLLMWLLTRVADSYPFVVLVQMVVFAALLACLTAVLHRCGVPAWLALVVHTVVAVSLPVRNTLMYFGKDSAMTIGILALTIQAVHILYTRGEWLKKPLHVLALGLCLAYTSLLRVNALFFTAPFVLCVFFAYRPQRKKTAAAVLVMALAMALVQGPLFGALDVVYPDNALEESIGVPMTILCDVRKTEPDKLDTETRLFMNSLAASKTWRETYVMHNYNSIKFTFPRELIAERSAGEILGMAGRAAWNAPRTAFKAVNGLTDIVWDVTGQGEGYQTVGNSGHIESARYGNATLNALGQKICRVWEIPMSWGVLAWLTENIGVQLLLLLLVTLWTLYRHGPEVLLMALPTLMYDLGTMCLLASNDARFFQFSMTIALPCMLALIFLPVRKEDAKA